MCLWFRFTHSMWNKVTSFEYRIISAQRHVLKSHERIFEFQAVKDFIMMLLKASDKSFGTIAVFARYKPSHHDMIYDFEHDECFRESFNNNVNKKVLTLILSKQNFVIYSFNFLCLFAFIQIMLAKKFISKCFPNFQ